jgi:opacity protein-like surface antigen
VEKHYSIGFTYKASDQVEVTGTYMHAASNNQTACSQNIVDCVQIGMHQNVFGLTFGWIPDGGDATGYGDGDWAGIDLTGLYAGFSFGQSKYRDIDAAWANTRSEGWKAYLGYEFNRYLALEGGYVNLNDMTAVDGVMNTNIATDAWALGAVARLPLTDSLSVFGKVGAAYMLADIAEKNFATGEFRRSGDDDFEPNYGVGASYAVLDNIDVRAEWERFERKDLDIDLMTAGVTLKF